jgi:hypothetical protein
MTDSGMHNENSGAQDWQISAMRQRGDGEATANADPCHHLSFDIVYLPSNAVFVAVLLLFVRKYLP